MRVAIRVSVAVLLCCVVPVPPVGAEDREEMKAHPYRGEALRLGGFSAFQIDTTVGVKSQSVPLGLHVDVSKDLGVTDSATVPKLMFAYRFAKWSQLDVDGDDQFAKLGRTLAGVIFSERSISRGGLPATSARDWRTAS